MSDFTENLVLPENWILCTFEDASEGENAIVDGPFGSNLKTSDYIDDKINGVPVLTTKNLEGDYSDEKVRFISREKFEELKRSQVNPGDIVVAKIGSIGKNGIYPKNGRTAIIPANLLKFTVSKKVVFNYVFQYLNFFGLQNKIKDIATATAQPAFNVTKFRQLEIPLPPLPEQRRIVAKIEELFSSLDKGIESLKTAQEQLKIYRQAVLKWAFEGRLTNKEVKDGELPEGWKILKLADLGNWKGGGTPSKHVKKYWENGTNLWVTSKDMKVGVIIDSIDKITDEAIKNSSAKRIPQGAILFVMRSGILRHTFPVAIAGKNLTVNQDLLTLSPNSLAASEFIYWFVRAFNHDIRQKCSKDGTTVESIEANSLKNYPFILAPVSEQHHIVSEIESRLSVCDKIEESIGTSLQQAEALRQSILKKAFEGKLVPQDPDDEPAGVLLERIKAEREKAAPAGRKVNSRRKSKIHISSGGA